MLVTYITNFRNSQRPSKDICQLIVWTYEVCGDVPWYNLLSNKMTIDQNVLGHFMKHGCDATCGAAWL